MGAWKMTWNRLLSGAIFHFHDSGRKGMGCWSQRSFLGGFGYCYKEAAEKAAAEAKALAAFAEQRAMELGPQARNSLVVEGWGCWGCAKIYVTSGWFESQV